MAVGALVVGLVVAALGVRAFVLSVQRDLAIRRYAEARSTAEYFVENGKTISASMERLQRLDDEDRDLMEQSRVALEAGDVDAFNALVVRTNAGNAQQQSLHDQIEEFQDAFQKAFEQ